MTLVALFAAASLLLAGGCASGGQGADDEGAAEARTQVELAVDDAIRPWVLDREAGVVIKLRLEDWGQIRPMVERFVTLPEPGEERAQNELLALLDRLSPAELPVEAMDASRPAYFVFNPRVETFSQACLFVGVPCLAFEPPSPRFFRFLLPAEAPAELAESLESISGSPLFQARPVGEGWVHVEALGGHLQGGPRDVERDWVPMLERRFERVPEPMAASEVTPAQATVLNAEAPVAAWMNIRAMIDMGVFIGIYDAADALSMVRRSRMMEMVVKGTEIAAGLFQLDASGAAEFFDVGMVIGGDGEGSVYLDSVMSRTEQGSRVAEAADGAVGLPTIALEQPEVSFEGALHTGAMREAAADIEWAGQTPPELAELLRNAGIWGYLGMLRAPAAIQKATDAQRGGVPRVPGIRAVRMAMSRDEQSGAPAPVTGGAVLVLDAGAATDQYLPALRGLDRGPKWLSTTIEEGEETVTVRVAAGAPMEELFPEDGATGEVRELTLSVDGEAVAMGVPQLLMTMGRTGRRLRRLLDVRGITPKLADLSVDLQGRSTERFTAARLEVAGQSGAGPEVVETSGALEQPKPRCLVTLGASVREMLRQAEGPADALEAFNAGRRDFIDGAEACVDEPETSDQMADWAVAAYETYRSVLAARQREEKTARQALSTACERGLEWTCEADAALGKFPWSTEKVD